MAVSINLIRGQKIDFHDIAPGLRDLSLLLTIPGPPSHSTFSALLLGQSGKVETPNDLLYKGNLENSNKSVCINTKNNMRININMESVPLSIQKIVFVLFTNTSNNLPPVKLQILTIKEVSEIANLTINETTNESAMVLGELYRHSSRWKFSALGSGFSGGVQAMCSIYGLKHSIILQKGELSILKHLNRIDTYIKNRQKTEFEKNQMSLGIVDTSIFGR